MTRTIIVLAALTLAVSTGVSPAEAAGVEVAHTKATPNSPNHTAWDSVKATDVVLTPQIIAPPVGGGATSKVSVKAAHDGKRLFVRLEWDDATPNRAVGVDRVRDAAAIGFPMTDEPTSPFMGDDKHPVAIWQWSANHQANNDGKGEFAEDYPKTDGVWYADHDASMSVRVHRWRGVEPVEHFVAKGFGTLTPEPDDTLTGTGVWADGTWSVVFQRKLDSSAAPDFVAGGSTEMIIAVWDGGSDEVNGRKSVTMAWSPLKLEK